MDCWSASDKPLNDLVEFELDPDGVNSTSKDLSTLQQGTIPAARDCHGFSSVLGMLYLHGGSGMNGEFYIRICMHYCFHIHSFSCLLK